MSDPKIKLSVVSYLNSKPFILSLEKSGAGKLMDISLDIPSECAAKLLDGRVDIGLVPVTVIPELTSAQIISNYCIAADGPVASVLLLSHTPLQNVKRILLDYQSKTSVQLVKILSKKLWNISPDWIDTKPGYEENINGNTAGLIIGDRAFSASDQFPYVYDLSEEWKKLTGLPFVFACWVSNKVIDSEIVKKFNESLSLCQQLIPQIIADQSSEHLSKEQIENYFAKNIHLVFDKDKKAGMELFLKYVKEE
ncbi:MAG TPA: menaquinone biosynthesis protein [Bacteroidia bacterium]|nr:menaquinone biosynthesis protein [Bacteroidia bacterium]